MDTLNASENIHTWLLLGRGVFHIVWICVASELFQNWTRNLHHWRYFQEVPEVDAASFDDYVTLLSLG